MVKPVPAYMEKDQAVTAYYDHGTPDGSRPGTVYVNTYDFPSRSLSGVEAIAYHEGIPGHHLQISLAQELTGLPEFRKYTYYTAYTEGWGLYAERLGKDVGFYQDPIATTAVCRGISGGRFVLVVDTGVHSEHWSRQQMRWTTSTSTPRSATPMCSGGSRPLRGMARPGLRLQGGTTQVPRAARPRAAGASGDEIRHSRAFHDELVDSGALPLSDIVEQRVDSWIAQQKTAGKRLFKYLGGPGPYGSFHEHECNL